MVDMYTVYRHCMEMMHEYAGIKVMCNYCAICCTLQIDFSCPALKIFAHYEYFVTETSAALTKLHKVFNDFILQPEIVKYLREESNHDNNR